jgi:hypothetical protein
VSTFLFFLSAAIVGVLTLPALFVLGLGPMMGGAVLACLVMAVVEASPRGWVQFGLTMAVALTCFLLAPGTPLSWLAVPGIVLWLAGSPFRIALRFRDDASDGVVSLATGALAAVLIAASFLLRGWS